MERSNRLCCCNICAFSTMTNQNVCGEICKIRRRDMTVDVRRSCTSKGDPTIILNVNKKSIWSSHSAVRGGEASTYQPVLGLRIQQILSCSPQRSAQEVASTPVWRFLTVSICGRNLAHKNQRAFRQMWSTQGEEGPPDSTRELKCILARLELAHPVCEEITKRTKQMVN